MKIHIELHGDLDEALWGVSDLLDLINYDTATHDEYKSAVRALVEEDLIAFIEDATWIINPPETEKTT